MPHHHPTRLRRLVELAIPHDAKRSMSPVLVTILCGVGNIGSAHVVAKRTEQTDKVLLPPLVPRPFPKGAHEKHILHPSVYGKKEDMQQAADTMHMYYATWIGRLQHGRASIHLALLCCCCCWCCLLLLPLLPLLRPCLLSATRSYSYSFFVNFFSPHIATGQVASSGMPMQTFRFWFLK